MQEIRTEHLTVGYDKTPLIGDVNLSVRPGEILTLIGPNGSGKSTILKTITKQLKKLDGTVFLGEASMDELKDSQISRRLSMVMTERLRTELMSGREVVASGRYPYTGRFGILSKEDWAKVDEAIALVHAGEVQDQDFMKISDGQRQRLMLARAICQDTKILILDEPTSYLDMGFKMDILTNIRMLARDKKMAVIMSLHELDLAQKVSDTIACVRGDRIDRVGTPEEIFAGNYVQELYGVADQSFDPVTGQIFLCTGHEKAVVSRDFSAENCSGKNFGCGKKNPDPVSPQFFVIGGAGSGIPVYNRLWRENIPFAAGILQENDVEYKAAVALASEVVSEKAFYPVGQDKVQAAKRLIESCKKCICAVEEFGPLNEANRELAEYARTEINRIGGYYAYSKELVNGDSIYDFDVTKLSIHTRDIGLAGIEVYDLLRDEYDIQAEFGDLGNILAYLSIGDRQREVERLVSALAEIKRRFSRDKSMLMDFDYIDPIVAMSPQEAFYGEKESLPIRETAGRVCSEFVMCYPPGIPILTPGEQITEEIIDYIAYALEKGCSMTGPEDPGIERLNVLK